MTDIKKPLREGRRAEHTGQDFTAPAGADAGMDRGEPSRRRGAFESRWARGGGFVCDDEPPAAAMRFYTAWGGRFRLWRSVTPPCFWAVGRTRATAAWSMRRARNMGSELKT